MAAQWNSRFVAYAASMGMGPDECLAHEKKTCPGGCMGEFIIWMRARWLEFDPSGYSHSAQDHIEFDAWLDSKFYLRGQSPLF